MVEQKPLEWSSSSTPSLPLAHSLEYKSLGTTQAWWKAGGWGEVETQKQTEFSSKFIRCWKHATQSSPHNTSAQVRTWQMDPPEANTPPNTSYSRPSPSLTKSTTLLLILMPPPTPMKEILLQAFLSSQKKTSPPENIAANKKRMPLLATHQMRPPKCLHLIEALEKPSPAPTPEGNVHQGHSTHLPSLKLSYLYAHNALWVSTSRNGNWSTRGTCWMMKANLQTLTMPTCKGSKRCSRMCTHPARAAPMELAFLFSTFSATSETLRTNTKCQ